MEELEEWRPVVGYEGYYEVSSLGRVRSIDRTYKSKLGKDVKVNGVMLSQSSNRNGYKERELHKIGITKTFRVHRIVAMAFIPNPEGKPYINHIDFDRTNNRVSNLEWCTPMENVNHSKHRMYNPVTGNYGADHPLSKSIDMYEVCIRKVGEFGSHIEASASINQPCSFVSASMKEYRQKIKGFVFIQDDKLKSNIGDVFAWSDVFKLLKNK